MGTERLAEVARVQQAARLFTNVLAWLAVTYVIAVGGWVVLPALLRPPNDSRWSIFTILVLAPFVPGIPLAVSVYRFTKVTGLRCPWVWAILFLPLCLNIIFLFLLNASRAPGSAKEALRWAFWVPRASVCRLI